MCEGLSSVLLLEEGLSCEPEDYWDTACTAIVVGTMWTRPRQWPGPISGARLGLKRLLGELVRHGEGL